MILFFLPLLILSLNGMQMLAEEKLQLEEALYKILNWDETILDDQQDEYERCAGIGKYAQLKEERMKFL